MNKLFDYLENKSLELNKEMKKVGSNSSKFKPLYKELTLITEQLDALKALKSKANMLVSYLTDDEYNDIDSVTANEIILKHRYLQATKHNN